MPNSNPTNHRKPKYVQATIVYGKEICEIVTFDKLEPANICIFARKIPEMVNL